MPKERQLGSHNISFQIRNQLAENVRIVVDPAERNIAVITKPPPKVAVLVAMIEYNLASPAANFAGVRSRPTNSSNALCLFSRFHPPPQKLYLVRIHLTPLAVLLRELVLVSGAVSPGIGLLGFRMFRTRLAPGFAYLLRILQPVVALLLTYLLKVVCSITCARGIRLAPSFVVSHRSLPAVIFRILPELPRWLMQIR